MSNLKFTVEFINRVSGAQHTVVVDLGEFTVRELEDAWHGPGKFTGPVAWAVAFQHASKRMGAHYMGRPETVRAHRVQ